MTDQEQLDAAKKKIGIGAIRRHVFLCLGPKCCTPEVGEQSWELLKQKLKDAGLAAGDDVCQRTRAGCLRICCQGPINGRLSGRDVVSRHDAGQDRAVCAGAFDRGASRLRSGFLRTTRYDRLVELGIVFKNT